MSRLYRRMQQLEAENAELRAQLEGRKHDIDDSELGAQYMYAEFIDPDVLAEAAPGAVNIKYQPYGGDTGDKYKPTSRDTCDSDDLLTIAYMSGLHEGKKNKP